MTAMVPEFERDQSFRRPRIFLILFGRRIYAP